MRPLQFFSLLLFIVPTAAAGQAKSPMALFPGIEIEWKDGPPALPKGAKMAILEGDPTQPGVFTMRLRFPDGFQVFPHWHTQTEHATVIKGTLTLGWASGSSARPPRHWSPARSATGPRGRSISPGPSARRFCSCTARDPGPSLT